MKWQAAIAAWLMLSLSVLADDEPPSLEMLLFLADFVDEQGNWDGPSIDDMYQENEINEAEQYD